MIISMKPLALLEVKEIVDKLEERDELKNYLKKFTKGKTNKSEKITEELVALNNLKLKKESIVKILDFSPKDSESLNKIFTETPLDEKETKEILEIVERY
jgi:DNA-directed RNA polymerase subunit F